MFVSLLVVEITRDVSIEGNCTREKSKNLNIWTNVNLFWSDCDHLREVSRGVVYIIEAFIDFNYFKIIFS